MKGLMIIEMNRLISTGSLALHISKAGIYNLISLNQGFEQQPVYY
jgi:hypothetical protein